MSREFGSYESGYFHTQMENAASDLARGGDELSRIWAGFFDEFQHVAYAIASSEAGDSSSDYPIFETMQRMKALKDRLRDVENFIAPFQSVAREAVRRANENKKGSGHDQSEGRVE